MAVARITDFGATGDGVTNDASAFHAAFTAAGDGGLVLVPTPPVSYRCKLVHVSKSVRIAGEGRRPLIQRFIGAGQNSLRVFELETDGITFENLAIDCHAVENFATCLSSADHDDIEVQHCYLFSSDEPPPFFDDLEPTIYAIAFKGCRNVLVEKNRTRNTEMKLHGASAGGVAGPGIRILDNFGTNCHDAGISVVTNGVQVISDVTIRGNILHDCFLGGIYVGADGDTNYGGNVKRLILADNIVSGYKTGGSGSIGIIARMGDVAEDWDIHDNIVFPGSKLAPGERYAIGIDLKSTDIAGPGKRMSVHHNRVNGADRWGIRATLFGGEVDISHNFCEDDEGILVLAKAAGTILTGAGNQSKPRGSRQAFRLQTTAGATLSASLGPQQLTKPLSIVEADPGSITVDTGGSNGPIDLTVVGPGPLVIDEVPYPIGEGDFGTEVNAHLATLDKTVFHSITMSGEQTSTVPIALTGFKGGLDVLAVGLRIVWNGQGEPIDFTGSEDVVIFGGRYRRPGASEDTRFVNVAAPGPAVESLGPFLLGG